MIFKKLIFGAESRENYYYELLIIMVRILRLFFIIYDIITRLGLALEFNPFNY